MNDQWHFENIESIASFIFYLFFQKGAFYMNPATKE